MDIFSVIFSIPQPIEWGLLGSVWDTLLRVFFSASSIESIGGFYTILVWFLTFGTIWLCFINPLRRLIKWVLKDRKR